MSKGIVAFGAGTGAAAGGMLGVLGAAILGGRLRRRGYDEDEQTIATMGGALLLGGLGAIAGAAIGGAIAAPAEPPKTGTELAKP